MVANIGVISWYMVEAIKMQSKLCGLLVVTLTTYFCGTF